MTTLLTDVQCLTAALAANPTDGGVRAMLVDAMLESGDEVGADFWRWLGERRRWPVYSRSVAAWRWWLDGSGVPRGSDDVPRCLIRQIDQAWGFADFDTVTDALRGLLAAWRALTPEQWAACWAWAPAT